jgi:hypothetical protein
MIPWYLYPAEGAWTPMEELYALSIPHVTAKL